MLPDTFGKLHDIAECFSLVMTFPLVALCFIIIVGYKGKFVLDVFHSKDTQALLLTGVAYSFLSKLLDNTYWAIPWSLSLAKSQWTDTMMSFGVYANIFSRQLFGLIAGYCHVRALFLTTNVPLKCLTYTLIIASVLGIIYVIAILNFR